MAFCKRIRLRKFLTAGLTRGSGTGVVGEGEVMVVGVVVGGGEVVGSGRVVEWVVRGREVVWGREVVGVGMW